MSDRIEKSIELKAPQSRVWKALTDHREFGTWFGVRLDGPFMPGQPSTGQLTIKGLEHIRWSAMVQKIEPERYFAYKWHPYALDPKVDYSGEPIDSRRVLPREIRQGHAAARRRVRLRQAAARAPRHLLPHERRRLGQAVGEHRQACRDVLAPPPSRPALGLRRVGRRHAAVIGEPPRRRRAAIDHPAHRRHPPHAPGGDQASPRARRRRRGPLAPRRPRKPVRAGAEAAGGGAAVSRPSVKAVG